jgi:spermidine synthase
MRRFVFILFFVSGALALVYEVVWLRLLVLVFGSTQFAVTSVLTAFMAGLALGSFLFGRYVDSSRRHPLALYGVLEIAIGLFALAVPYLLKVLSSPAVIATDGSASFYTASAVRFVFALVVLLVPPIRVVGTLPVLTRVVTRREEEIAASVGSLYATNTLGAVAGTTLAGLWLIPSAGVSRTIALAACGNLVLGFLALIIARGVPVAEASPPAPSPVRGSGPARTRQQKRRKDVVSEAHVPSRVALWAAASSGLLALVYEIAWTRVLTLILGSSVYAFTAMLATFLVGLAVGAFAGSRLVDRLRTRLRLLQALATTIAFAAAAGYGTLLLLPRLPVLFARTFNAWGLAAPDVASAGDRALYLISIEFAFAFLVMFPATVFMGIVFPLVVRLWAGRIELVGKSVGTVYAANTVGTILGALLGGFVILPLAGLQGGILVAVAGGLVLTVAIIWSFPGWSRARRSTAVATAIIVAALLVANRPGWDPLVMNSGIYQYAPDLQGTALTAEEFASLTHEDVELLFYEEGLTANVIVGRRPSTGNVWMSINGKIDASSKTDLETQLLLGHLPMLLGGHAPGSSRQVAVIGYATGITTGAVTRHEPAGVVAVEIESAVLRASAYFDAFNYKPLGDPRVRAVEADGRSFLFGQRGRFDVIISEPSSPWMTMAANLFTREFFEIGRRVLAPGGVFCQWIQLYGLPLDDLRSLLNTFAAVFPQVIVFWGIPGQDIIVLGSEAPLPIDLGTLQTALADPEIARDLDRIGIRSGEDLLVYYLMGDRETRTFVADAPLNTDDNALIEFRAPLTMHTWARTLQANAGVFRRLAVDPLTHATGLSTAPAARANAYMNLGKAFYEKRMFGRAAGAIRRAQELHPTPEGEVRLAGYEAAAAKAAESE